MLWYFVAASFTGPGPAHPSPHTLGTPLCDTAHYNQASNLSDLASGPQPQPLGNDELDDQHTKLMWQQGTASYVGGLATFPATILSPAQQGALVDLVSGKEYDTTIRFPAAAAHNTRPLLVFWLRLGDPDAWLSVAQTVKATAGLLTSFGDGAQRQGM
eukprot:gene5452-5455_t